MSITSPPLSDGIIYALAAMIDDSQSEKRDPSHADIEHLFQTCGLIEGDPRKQGFSVGKEKRTRATLGWALEHNFEAGQRFVSQLIHLVRSRGGFRIDSPNFVGTEPIRNIQLEFAKEGFDLSEDGDLRPKVLDSLSGQELTEALRSYVRRAQKGSEDAALVTGTGKDLLEAVAGHVLLEINYQPDPPNNFPALLGQAFIALDLQTSQHPKVDGERPQCRMQRGLFEAALAVNTLRNKQGTGHGHPWLPDVTDADAKLAIQVMGTVANMMLNCLNRREQ